MTHNSGINFPRKSFAEQDAVRESSLRCDGVFFLPVDEGVPRQSYQAGCLALIPHGHHEGLVNDALLQLIEVDA